MPNNSSAAGYITPTTTPVYDDALDDILQIAAVGITAIDGTLVRPRLQREPLPMPAVDESWLALGVISIERDYAEEEEHDSGGDGDSGGNGQDILQHDELIEVLYSFYGPNAALNESTLRVGLQLAQNREQLQVNNLEFMEQRKALKVPAQIKNVYVNRIDTTVIFRRRAQFTYNILNILSASVELQTDVGFSSTTNVTN